MDGWVGDLVLAATYLCSVGVLVLLYMWLEALCASGKHRSDLAAWQRRTERERTELTARKMVREMEEQAELERMYRLSGRRG